MPANIGVVMKPVAIATAIADLAAKRRMRLMVEYLDVMWLAIATNLPHNAVKAGHGVGPSRDSSPRFCQGTRPGDTITPLQDIVEIGVCRATLHGIFTALLAFPARPHGPFFLSPAVVLLRSKSHEFLLRCFFRLTPLEFSVLGALHPINS
ncbi:leukocyte elastase inhibitor-like protein [Lasius niger]|uniref:Leukocyte elastase inhibitor-like protein n=1 Tax=Lasius niger TaxID=67767 RepID=A0A0J7K056_LASNI|nr:leukocyte elastase inhibitor-like protein [Lasius niger]